MRLCFDEESFLYCFLPIDLIIVHFADKDYGVPGVMVPQVTSQLPIHPDVKLKPLPFYDQVAPLLKPSTLGLWSYVLGKNRGHVG